MVDTPFYKKVQLCLQNGDNSSVVDYFLSISFPRGGYYIKFDTTEEWFKCFRQIDCLAELYWVVWEVQGEHAITPPKPITGRYSRFWNPQIVKQTMPEQADSCPRTAIKPFG